MSSSCNDVESKLKRCTVENNFYGGGSLGKVVGTVTSELDSCEVKGNVFGAGYSASLPTLEVRDAGFTQNPNYNKDSGMFEPGTFSGTTTFDWKKASEAGVTLTNGQSGSDLTNPYYIYTNVDLSKSNLGSVGNVQLTIIGTTQVKGSVYGGGEESVVTGNTKVTLQEDTEVVGNVFGGGDKGIVKGNTVVTLQGDTEVEGNVFGGGDKGIVKGSTVVTLQDDTEVEGNVFGGGDEGIVEGSTEVNM